MTKRIRFIIFLILLVLFLISAPAVILYSLGYRIDFLEKKLIQTGALFLKILPPQAEVSISPPDAEGVKIIKELTGQNKTIKRKTNFISGALFAKNLFPQKYNIKITKQGFYSWEKNLDVLGGLVSEAKDIILIPQNPLFKTLAENIVDFWISPNKKRLIFEDFDRGLFLYDVEKNSRLSQITTAETEISRGDFLDLAFSADSKRALLKIGAKQEIKYLILNLEAQNLEHFSLSFLGTNIKELFFNPKNSDEIFFVKKFPEGDFLFSANYIKKETSEPILAEFLAFEIGEKETIWLNNKGFLLRGGVFDKVLEYLNPEKPFSVDINKEYQIIFSGQKIFLRENTNLYYFNNDSKEFDKIFENLKFSEFSPDAKKLMLANNYELWVFFLEDQNYQPYKKAGQKVFLTRFSEKINQCSWFSVHYLIFTLNGQIKIAEIDDRDRINIVDLSPAAPPPEGGGAAGPISPTEKIFFNHFNKKLYILTNDKNFYASEKPLR